MTITTDDEQWYQATVSDFHAQINEDNCLPAAIKNILSNLADNHDEPGLDLSLSEVNDICGYKEGFYCQEEIIPDQLTNEVSTYGFETYIAKGADMDADRLQAIINNDDASLPVVELDPAYFHTVDGYRVQESPEMPPHVVVVFTVNVHPDDS